MEPIQQGILILLRSAITGQALPLPEGFDLEKAYPQIKRHQLIPLAYEGAVNCGVDMTQKAMIKLCDGYCQSLMRMTEQLEDVSRICEAFEAENIDYMLLKGSKLNRLYPKPELRVMADADILIRLSQRQQIQAIMDRLGFRQDVESDHELHYDSDALHLELHKRLVPSYHATEFAYFGDGWDRAVKQTGCCYDMKPEDEYIFLFAHFAKHYTDGGIGLRHALDLWVFRRAHPALDDAYVTEELDKLGLACFHENVTALLNKWFADGQGNETSDFLGAFIFQSGVWGDLESRYLAEEAKERNKASSFAAGRLKSILRVIFPSREYAQVRYPILRKFPFLLPGVWVVIWVRTLLFNRGAIQRRKQQFQTVTDEKLDAYRRSMEFVGIKNQ
jgi:hypothetical protein